MKKLTTAIAAIILAVTSVFALTACGQTPEQQLASYIESEDFQTQLDSMKASFGSMLDIEVKAEDSKLVMNFAYTTQIPDEQIDTMKDTLDSTFQAMSSTFETLAGTLEKEVGIQGASVVINLNNADGKNITSLEFKAK